ncbi:MAG: hypothetical protein VYE43_00605 [Pseudomonadota bacterium]|nr:hypothetical protein [Pseudomonadota bacterium]
MYRRPLIQSGRGIGGLFRSLVRVIKPVASTLAKTSKAGLKQVAKSKLVKDVSKDLLHTGAKTAIESLNDLAEGKKITADKIESNFKKLGKKSLKRASNTIAQAISPPANQKKKKYVKKKPKKHAYKKIWN